MKKRKLPRLRRGWRIALDIVIMLACLGPIWAALGYPMSAEQTFRHAERCCWVGPAEIQSLGERYGTVGTYQDQALIQDIRYARDYWPRNPEGPTLIPVEMEWFAAVDVPEGTASARLEAEVSCWYSKVPGGGWELRATEDGTAWSKHYQAEGELLEEGGVLFRISPQGDTETEDGNIEWLQLRRLSEKDTYHQPGESRVNARLEAVFYDKDGGELGRAVLCTPEG